MRVIDSLRKQSMAPTAWELLVVDNKSNTAVEDRFPFNWHPDCRVIREEKLGLTNARLRGIGEANGSLLVFVDDDNVLDEDFLEVALRISTEKPFLGSWSGQCIPEFETEPAEWTKRFWGNLVIREFEQDAWSNLPRLAETMPCGAGLVVRADVAAEYQRVHRAGLRSLTLDRTGDSLLSGGDNDLAACATALGYGMGIVSDLRLTHLISSDRLTVDYLSRLAEGIHYSSIYLDVLYGVTLQPRNLVGKLVDLIRVYREKRPGRAVIKASYRGRNKALKEVNDQLLANHKVPGAF